MTKQLAGILLTILACIAAGCGSGNSKAVFSKRVNEKIAAYEYARAVNLRAEDLPGTESVGEEEEDFGSTVGLGGCPVEQTVGLRRILSPNFLSHESFRASLTKGTSVRSAILVFPHRALPTADLASHGPAFRSCLRRADQQHARFGRTDLQGLSHLPAPLPGVTSFGSRTILVQQLRKPLPDQRVLIYEDTLGFLLGRAEVVLHTESRGNPFPARREHELLARLYSRATRAKRP